MSSVKSVARAVDIGLVGVEIEIVRRDDITCEVIGEAEDEHIVIVCDLKQGSRVDVG